MNCGKSYGWLIGSNITFHLKSNDGNPNKLTRTLLTKIRAGGVYGQNVMYWSGRDRTLIMEDYMVVGGRQGNPRLEQHVLECSYWEDSRRSSSVYYWYKSRPALADPARLSSRVSNHPLLLVMDAREDCPVTLTTETIEKRQILLDRM